MQRGKVDKLKRTSFAKAFYTNNSFRFFKDITNMTPDIVDTI